MSYVYICLLNIIGSGGTPPLIINQLNLNINQRVRKGHAKTWTSHLKNCEVCKWLVNGARENSPVIEDPISPAVFVEDISLEICRKRVL